MCLTIPAKILEIVDSEIPLVKVQVAGVVKTLPSLLQDPRVGDYVTIYGGAVIERLDVDSYNNIIRLWREAAQDSL